MPLAFHRATRKRTRSPCVSVYFPTVRPAWHGWEREPRTSRSPRRVRARLEKEGGPDSLMTQILERKVIDRILEDTVIEDVQAKIEPQEDVETIDYTLEVPVPAAEAEAEAESES